MATNLNFGKFMNDHDMVLCNNVAESFPLEHEFKVPENFEPYQYFLTNFSENDVEYYTETYGLKFAYCEELDLYVFLNDVCFGMSFNDVVIKPLPTMEDLEYFKNILLEVSGGIVGFQAGCIEAYDDFSAILDEPVLIEFAEEFVKKLEEAGFKATILKDQTHSKKGDTYCAVVFGKEIAEALDYMLSKGCYELMSQQKKGVQNERENHFNEL